jgi:hypothetical protein
VTETDSWFRTRTIFAPSLENEEDDELAAAAAQANLALLQRKALDDLIASKENDVRAEDRAVLETCMEMTLTEFALLETLVRVYDHARSHFIYEICEPSVKRFLNATRIRQEEDGGRMPFSLYRTTLMDWMQNSSILDGLISYVLKPRENGCTLSLWVAERVAERRLLNDDGIAMGEERHDVGARFGVCDTGGAANPAGSSQRATRRVRRGQRLRCSNPAGDPRLVRPQQFQALQPSQLSGPRCRASRLA